MLAVMEEIRNKSKTPYRHICASINIAYPSFIRWRSRQKKALPLLKTPGPSKIATPDLKRLQEEIKQLSHKDQRSRGTQKLYRQYRQTLSRREFNQLVLTARQEQNSLKRQQMKRICWNVPNVAWTMDPCEYEQRNEFGRKMYLHQMQDLASRYKFSPIAAQSLTGEEISGYLAELFDRFGAPLFLKRDNGSNLNHRAVNDMLAEYFVVPINSPLYYPPYNGAIEEAQSELKAGLNQKLQYRPYCPNEHIEAYAATVENDLNHRLRPCLNNKNACQVYFRNRKTFTKWERREAYEWITDLQNDILREKEIRPQTAWRIAVETWLNKKGYITITKNGKVSPNSFLKNDH